MALSPKQLRFVFAKLRAEGLLKYVKKARKSQIEAIAQVAPEALKRGTSVKQVMTEGRAKSLINRLPSGHQKDVSISLHVTDVNIPRPQGIHPAREIIGSYDPEKNLINLQSGSRPYTTSIGYTLKPSHVPRGKAGSKTFEARNGQLGSAKAFYHEYGHSINLKGTHSDKADWKNLLSKEWKAAELDPNVKGVLKAEDAWSEAYSQYFSTKRSRGKLKTERPLSYAYMDKLSKTSLAERAEAITKLIKAGPEKAVKLTAEQAAEDFARRVDGIKEEITTPGRISPKKRVRLLKKVETLKQEAASKIEDQQKKVDVSSIDKKKQNRLINKVKALEKKKAEVDTKAKQAIEDAEKAKQAADAAAEEAKKARRAAIDENFNRGRIKRYLDLGEYEPPPPPTPQEDLPWHLRKPRRNLDLGPEYKESEWNRKIREAKAEIARVEKEAQEAQDRAAAVIRAEAERVASVTQEAQLRAEVNAVMRGVVERETVERAEAVTVQLDNAIRDAEATVTSPGLKAKESKISKKVIASLIASGGLAAAIATYLKLRKKKPKKKIVRQEEPEKDSYGIDVEELERILRKDSKKWQREARRKSQRRL